MGLRQGTRLSLWFVAVCAAAGCVTVYHPMAGLQRPIAVDTQRRNFPGLRIQVNCHHGEHLDRTGTRMLCRKVSAMLRNQGAVVRTNQGDGADADWPDPGGTAPATAAEPGGGFDLAVDLRSRSVHVQRNPLLWTLCIMSLTLIPARGESTFVQDVVVRDATGFLLASETLEARFVRHFGGPYWLLNWFLDKAVREEHERLGSDAISRDFSRDFYGQISQLVLNAHLRSSVLHPSGRVAPRPTSAGAPATGS